MRRLFFNPLAKHLLISMESGDNFYLFEKWKKPRILNKFRVSASRHNVNRNYPAAIKILYFRVSLLNQLHGDDLDQEQQVKLLQELC